MAGHGGGWRHGLGVLAAAGMAGWMATWAALPTPAGFGGTAGTTPRADSSSSTSTPPPSTPSTKGGPEPARSSFLPAATSEVVAVLAAMTLAHARAAPFPVQEAVPP